MSKPIVRCLIVVLALSALLGSPAVSLAGGSRASVRHSGHQTAAQSPLSWLWNALVSGWEKEGCRIDPNGRCITVAAPVPGDSLQATANGKYERHFSSN